MPVMINAMHEVFQLCTSVEACFCTESLSRVFQNDPMHF